MRERRRLERLLNEIDDLVKKIKNYDKSFPEISNQIKYKVLVLESAVNAFEQLNQASFSHSNVDIEKLQKEPITPSSHLTEQDLKLLSRAKSIENEAVALSNHLSDLSKENKEEESRETKSPPKPRTPLKRRGGDTKWIPL